MNRKHLILLLLPFLILAGIFATRSLLILRSNAEYDRIVRELRQTLTPEVSIEEIGSYLKEAGLNRPYHFGSNHVMAYCETYRDGLQSFEYATGFALGPYPKSRIVIHFTPDGKFESVE